MTINDKFQPSSVRHTPMNSTPTTIYEKLQRLGRMIDAGRLERMRPNYHWRGADVKITDDPKFATSERHWLDDDVVVCTPHVRELSWLFCQLRDVFTAHLDFRNKYGFYGELAENALRHLERNKSDEDFRPLLRKVLEAGYAFCDTIVQDGAIPPNATIVIHTRDAAGKQLRFEL